MNQHLATRLEGIRRSVVVQASASNEMPTASRGAERELFVRTFLQAAFPTVFRFGSGAITDRHGARTGQVDVVVELPFVPSLPMPPSDHRLYLAEGVAAAIEIKSDLSAQWGEVEDTTASILTLKRSMRAGALWRGPAPFEFVPTLAVGYRGYSTVDGLCRRLDSTHPDRRPIGALVLGDPGVFIVGRKAGTGADAMLLFLAFLTKLCTQVVNADFDVNAYVDWE
jgi:hypothetical protein